MGGDTPKVLLPLLGRPMVQWVVDGLLSSGAAPVCCVCSDSTLQPLRDLYSDDPRIEYCLQKQPKGSGDAAASAVEALAGRSRHVVVACGDSPLFRPATVELLMKAHIELGAVVTLASALLENPAGYGRIARTDDGAVAEIVEARDIDAGKPDPGKEINGGLYAFDADWLWNQLKQRWTGRGEFVLTEVVRRAAEDRLPVKTVLCDADEVAGVNTPDELKRAEAILAKRISIGYCFSR